MGKKRKPQYKIVVINSKKSTNGKYIENLGYYHILSNKSLKINIYRIIFWINKGCKISKTVNNLIKNLDKITYNI